MTEAETKKIESIEDRITPEELIKQPNLLHTIKEIIDYDVIGEDRNKLLIFLACCSSLLQDDELVLGAVLSGESSIGKSHLLKHITKHFQDRLIWFSRITGASLNYLNDKNLTGKIMVIEELEGVGDNPQLRIMMSEHGLTLLTTEKEDGQYKAKEIKIQGSPAFFTCTTRKNVETQLNTRVFKITPDDSPEQTRRIFLHKAWREGFPPPRPPLKRPGYLPQALQGLSPFVGVIVPFIKEIVENFPDRFVRGRRDLGKLINVIKIIAWLHQYQRSRIIKVFERKDKDDIRHEYVLASVIDLKYAMDILADSFQQTITGVVPSARDLYNKIQEREYVSAPDLARELHIPYTSMRDLLWNLVEAGLLILDKSERPHRYYLQKEGSNSTINYDVFQNLPFSEKEYLSRLRISSTNLRENEHIEIQEKESIYIPLFPNGEKISEEEKKIEEKKDISVEKIESVSQIMKINTFLREAKDQQKRQEEWALPLHKNTYWEIVKERGIPEAYAQSLLDQYADYMGESHFNWKPSIQTQEELSE